MVLVSALVYTICRCTQETVYSLGWEDMGAVAKLNKWIKNRWGSVKQTVLEWHWLVV